MAFAGGVTAFPGGAVDPGDDLADARWSGPRPRLVGTSARCRPSPPRAAWSSRRSESCSRRPACSWSRPRAGLSEEDRLEILGRRRTFDAALAGAGCVLDSALLRPWANWVTPPGRTRRYDTFFFLAALPDGQQARLLTTEADVGQWVRPDALLAEREPGPWRSCRRPRAMLTDLAALRTPSPTCSAARRARDSGCTSTTRAGRRQPVTRRRRRVRVTDQAAVLLAANPGPMTLGRHELLPPRNRLRRSGFRRGRSRPGRRRPPGSAGRARPGAS